VGFSVTGSAKTFFSGDGEVSIEAAFLRLGGAWCGLVFLFIEISCGILRSTWEFVCVAGRSVRIGVSSSKPT
jgi:hypothetical protein